MASKMQQGSSNSTIAMFTSTLNSVSSIIFHTAASPSTYKTSSLTSDDGKSTTTTIVTAETLLRLGNVDLSNLQVKLLIKATLQNSHQTQLFSDFSEQCRSCSSLSSFGGSFEKKTESEWWNDEGFSRKIQSPKSVIEKTEEGLNTLLKIFCLRCNKFQKFAALRYATRSHASSSGAGEAPDSYSVPLELSSSSSSSSSKAESGASEGGGEEVIQWAGVEDGERRNCPHWRRIPVFQRERGQLMDTKLTEISLSEARGYYTFAQEVWCESPMAANEDNQPTLLHVCCPWVPRFSSTEYYAEMGEMEVLLDPLTLSWKQFIQRIDKVVMITEQQVVIAVQVFRGGNLEYNLRIPRKSVYDSNHKFLKAMYFYHAAYGRRDPDDLDPVYYPWEGAQFEYYNAQGHELLMPQERGEEESDGDAETDQEEQEEEESGGEILDDENDAMDEISPWGKFMDNLFAVHIRILD